ncbi:MAG: hypothetical protein LPK45_08425, partial [Bacteroidota bacterium]|nr:hypothetical protein [Bacteroidota bacterium]MDX5431095.1 hypothetical protein [Bacteroidota bacterium]MDX5469847.1 hypothetical protein [Bacteroidota bacterium]
MTRSLFQNKSQTLWALKALVLLLSVWLLYKEVILNERFRTSLAKILTGELEVRMEGLVFVFLLLFVNWAFETLKWKVLISEFESPSFLHAYKAIFTGALISLFTPNRMGEFAGRVLYVKEKKIEAAILTIAGSLAQT